MPDQKSWHNQRTNYHLANDCVEKYGLQMLHVSEHVNEKKFYKYLRYKWTVLPLMYRPFSQHSLC